MSMGWGFKRSSPRLERGPTAEVPNVRVNSTTMAVVAAGAVALLAGCGGGTHGRSSGLAVSVKSSASAATSTPAGLSVPQGVTISRIRLAVRRVSVEGGDASGVCDPSLAGSTTPMVAMKDGGSGSGSSGDDGRSDDGAQRSDDGECEFAFGPFDVDLAGSALSGGVDFAFDAPIPAGTYREVSITVNTVPAARAGGNPVLEDLSAAHASILVDGFVEDASTIRPFTFAAPLEVKQKREGAIVIGPSSNVTLTFDPSGWFSAGGSRLDPTAPAAQGAILANIRASLRLVHDDDHDGHDDDDGPGHH
jgi:hypothetical protein